LLECQVTYIISLTRFRYVKWHISSVWHEFVRMSSDIYIISLTRVC